MVYRNLTVLAAMTVPALSSFADLPILWRVELQARGTNAAGIATFNLPSGAQMTSQTPAIAEDGSAAVRFTSSTGAFTDGYFIGMNGSGHTTQLTTSGSGSSSSDLDFAAGLLATTAASNPSAVSLRSPVDGSTILSFGDPNPELIATYTRPRILPDAISIGYRGATSAGVRKWIVDRRIGANRTQTVYLTDGPSSNYSFLYGPTTNAHAHLGGKVDDFNGFPHIIRADSPLARTEIFDGSAPNVDFVAGGTDMNDADQVAFFVRFLSGPTTIFRLLRGNGVTTTTIANAGDAGIQSATMANFPPAINNNGWVAFRARDAAGDALFVGDGTRIVRIAGMSDAVSTDLGTLTLGYTYSPTNIQALSGSIDINSNGSIAFCGILNNGCIGLFIATPCFADFNGDLAVDFFDYLDFVAAFSAGSTDADFNHDGSIDFFDYLDFLDAFSRGC